MAQLSYPSMRAMLSDRDIWQDRASADGAKLEEIVAEMLATALADLPQFHVARRPRDLANLYEGRWGAIPDLSISNIATSKKVWVEIKRQQAAGNAHERACKYLAPGMLQHGERISGVPRPFFFIFANGIADNPDKSAKYRAEISTWFDAPGWSDHVLIWQNHDLVDLLDFFERGIRSSLE